MDSSRSGRFSLEAFLISTGIVALAEIGDKTQLLAFILAAKFRKPLPIILGILVATLVNHGVAAFLGTWLTSLISPGALRWGAGVVIYRNGGVDIDPRPVGGGCKANTLWCFGCIWHLLGPQYWHFFLLKWATKLKSLPLHWPHNIRHCWQLWLALRLA
jgi:hypothetical protein